MSYPGNASLSPAVKERVVSTFKQSLSLYRQGRTEEVVQGCNLILQMDPAFDPARKLVEKARNPMALIDVDALLPTDNASTLQQAREAMAARDFDRVVHLTTEILNQDFLNEEARVLGDEAREKLEAAPFIDQFVRRCEQALAAGNIAAAKADLEKARSLDATHPDVIRIARGIADRGTTPVAKEATPAFVVDAAPAFDATGRGTAQAADFGFTFEEEKPVDVSFGDFSFGAPAAAPPTAPADAPFGGGFSFDTPPAQGSAPAFDFGTPAAAPSNDFDFSTASIDTSPDDAAKIEQYLADGDRAYEAGDYQHAIDLWSRIFLIDVTNDQASERIERAKGKRREIETQVETLLAEGVEAFESKDRATARERFAEVLRLDPNNHTAQEFFERLSDTVAEGGAVATEAPYIPPSPAKPLDIFADEELPAGYEAPLVPPDPSAGSAPAPAVKKSGTVKAVTAPRPAVKKKAPLGLIAAVVAVLAVGAGGWFAWSKLMSRPETSQAATQDIFLRAQRLAKRGQYEQAIAALQDIPASDPQHDRALEMIADLQQKKSSSTQTFEGKPAGQYFSDNVAQAQAAFESHDYDAAKRAYENAMRVGPLDPSDKAQYDQASQQVAKLANAKTLFLEHKYADAITTLQALQATDPTNKNIQRMINDAHFNLGATALQDERTKDATAQFDEVLKNDPNDELARRSRELANRYEGQPKDLLYHIYVKYLPLRQPS